MKNGIELLETVVPVVREYISPVITGANDMQKDVGNINIKKGNYGDYGIWKTVICINALTDELHCEIDSSLYHNNCSKTS